MNPFASLGTSTAKRIEVVQGPQVPLSAPREFQIHFGGDPSGPWFHVSFEGGSLNYTAKNEGSLRDGLDIPRTAMECFQPSERQWRAFWRRMDAIDFWNWSGTYSPPEDMIICDGTNWSVKIAFGDLDVDACGSNAFPGAPCPFDSEATGDENYEQRFLKAVRALVGDRPFH